MRRFELTFWQRTVWNAIGPTLLGVAGVVGYFVSDLEPFGDLNNLILVSSCLVWGYSIGWIDRTNALE